jgi:hypothetical protein
MALRREGREETIASSDMAKRPLRIMSKDMAESPRTSIGKFIAAPAVLTLPHHRRGGDDESGTSSN